LPAARSYFCRECSRREESHAPRAEGGASAPRAGSMEKGCEPPFSRAVIFRRRKGHALARRGALEKCCDRVRVVAYGNYTERAPPPRPGVARSQVLRGATGVYREVRQAYMPRCDQRLCPGATGVFRSGATGVCAQVRQAFLGKTGVFPRKTCPEYVSVDWTNTGTGNQDREPLHTWLFSM
jgi:hypothetical protein